MGKSSRYTILGYNGQSSEIVFSDFPTLFYPSSGQELRMRYEEDLKDQDEPHNNGGDFVHWCFC